MVVQVDGVADGGDFYFGPLEAGGLGFYLEFFQAGLEGLYPHEFAGDDVCGDGAPGVVPVLVGFVFVVPGFHGDGAAGAGAGGGVLWDAGGLLAADLLSEVKRAA